MGPLNTVLGATNRVRRAKCRLLQSTASSAPQKAPSPPRWALSTQSKKKESILCTTCVQCKVVVWPWAQRTVNSLHIPVNSMREIICSMQGPAARRKQASVQCTSIKPNTRPSNQCCRKHLSTQYKTVNPIENPWAQSNNGTLFHARPLLLNAKQWEGRQNRGILRS